MEEDWFGPSLEGFLGNNSDRPDADGILTKEEGIGWAKESSAPLFLSGELLDLGNTSTDDFSGVGSTSDINLLYKGAPKDVRYTYGTVEMQLMDQTGHFKIGRDKFDWSSR